MFFPWFGLYIYERNVPRLYVVAIPPGTCLLNINGTLGRLPTAENCCAGTPLALALVECGRLSSPQYSSTYEKTDAAMIEVLARNIHDQDLDSVGLSSRALLSPRVRSYAHAYPDTSIFPMPVLKKVA